MACSMRICVLRHAHPAIHQPWGQGRADWLFCLQPTLQGRVASIGFNRPDGLDRQGKRRSEQRQLAEAAEEAEEDGSQTCQTPHMIDYLLHGGHGIEERGMLEHRKHW